jgi:KUP system potassium uptake protein
MKLIKSSDVIEIIKSIGIVFGDIGTSPLYTLNALIFFVSKPADIFGLVSLIVWTLVILVCIEYAWLATSLGSRGEGGTIVLLEQLTPLLKSTRTVAIVTFLAFIDISLFMGDGVITPAVTILNAVEGVLVWEGLKWLPQTALVVAACLIAIGLFVLQRRGVERVSVAFGPIMLIWFVALAVTGFISIIHYPAILGAINPLHGFKFLVEHGAISFLVLASVVLCATGSEALYADMGHLGRLPILRAWYFIFIALVLSYLGQGAFLITHPGVVRVLQEMVFFQSPFLYVPFFILGIIASVIASQALISGVFSVVYQGIMTGVLPRLKVDYTSRILRSQVYIGTANWMLLSLVLFMIIKFQQSLHLIYAYGLAVTGSMLLTGFIMACIFYLRRSWIKFAMAVVVTGVDAVFFTSTLSKFSFGGYYSFLIALIPFSIILIYTRGQRRKHEALSPVSKEEFLSAYDACLSTEKLKGTALFFVRDEEAVPSYVMRTMFRNKIVYEDTVFVHMVTSDKPFGVTWFFKEELVPGVRIFEIHQGYMEVLDIEQVLRTADIDPLVIFYGMHEIITKNPLWRVYAVIDRLSPSFAQFYQLPPHKLHGVITLVEM